MKTGARFSRCRKWRYVLWRVWGDGERVTFIGLNPSTADETTDDATIRRCIGFAKKWGYGGLYMVNLFAFRATQPSVLFRAADPVGLRNDGYILRYSSKSALTVAAWGNHGDFQDRAEQVCDGLFEQGDLRCFGKTKNGSPKHPVRLASKTRLSTFR